MQLTIISLILIATALILEFLTNKNKLRYIFLFLGVAGCLINFIEARNVATDKRYEYISKLSFNGSEQDFFMPNLFMPRGPNNPEIPEGLPKILYGSYTNFINEKEKNVTQYSCDPLSVEKYKQAIKFNQDFPFSYWALASCKINAQENLKKTLDILRITTQIKGHHKNHDMVLNDIENSLK